MVRCLFLYIQKEPLPLLMTSRTLLQVVHNLFYWKDVGKRKRLGKGRGNRLTRVEQQGDRKGEGMQDGVDGS